MKKQFITKACFLALTVMIAVGCSKSDSDKGGEGKPVDQYLVAVQAKGTGEKESTYFIPVESLDNPESSITPVGTGLEVNNTFSNYISNGFDGFVTLKYGQGQAHVGTRVTINNNGKAIQIGQQFEIQDGFVTAGIVGDAVYSAMSGNRAKDKTKATFNIIPMSPSTPEFAYMQVDQFAGYKGKNAALVGIADAGNGSFYTGLDYSADEIDELVVAKVKANNLKPEAVYKDTRLSKSGGQYRSARYSQIGETSKGDVYVFSGNYAGTKTAGALLLKKGTTGFDKDYFWDIEKASQGYRFRKVWYVQDDIFLLEFYNEKSEAGKSVSGVASQFALLDMVSKKFTWVTGLPDKSSIPDLGTSEPYILGGKIYLGLKTTIETPRFYVINPLTGEGKKGLLVKDAEAIEGATFVKQK